MGLREAKKAQTRKLVSDIGRDLFIEKGFDNVTVSEIAAQANIAVATLFNYFPTKESILFDLDDEIDADLVRVLRERKAGTSVLKALHEYFLESKLFNPPHKKTNAGFGKLIKTTPQLSSYLSGLWTRYSETLAKEMQHELQMPKSDAEAVSRMLMEGVSHACMASNPKESLNFTFKILKSGWKE